MAFSIPIRSALLIVMTACLVAACTSSGKRVRGEPPLTSIDSLQRHGGGVIVDLAVRNINDQALEITAIDLEISLADTDLGSGRRDDEFRVSARGREIIRVPIEAAHDEAMATLEQISGGERTAAPWQLQVELHHPRGGSIRAEGSGWLHAVPGQPDRFR